MNNIKAKIASAEINFIKKEYIKVLTRWVEQGTKERKEDENFKDRFLSKDTLKWFRNLGGKETVKQGSLHGYGCTIHTSISPDGTEKKVNYFFY